MRLAPEVTLDKANQEVVTILAAIEDLKRVQDQDQEIDFKTLNLKKFTGGRARGLQKWEAWWPSYYDLVHKRNGASAINKLDFLKSKMEGDASTLIASVPMTSAGYEQAIQRLQRAFGNREFATWNFTWDLLDIPAVKEESAEVLTKLFSSFQLALNGLRHHHAESIVMLFFFFCFRVPWSCSGPPYARGTGCSVPLTIAVLRLLSRGEFEVALRCLYVASA